MQSLNSLFALLPFLALGQAATMDQWRDRSLYALLTDRFAPSTPNAPCDVKEAKYCGGTYRSIQDKLDYIQGMGFDAVWISPTGLQLEGYTQYGEAYHGFWSIDPTRSNFHYGSEDDLKALSKAIHDRGMYLMVDMQVNQLCSTSTDISDAALAGYSNGQLLFKKNEHYHPACNIQWGNHESEQTCWLATQGVMLMDLKTETPAVADVYKEWIPKYIAEYGIDGMRIDGTKQMGKEFQHDFCEAAGVFCIGEMAGDNAEYAGSYMGQDGLDSVFGFAMMYGLQKTFAQGNDMNSLKHYIDQAKTAYPDPSVISTIMDNQDNPRFNSLTQDKNLVYNALVFSFLYSNLPNIYYGTEVDITFGSTDPDNRAALWQFNPEFSTTMSPTYARFARLNKIRKEMGKADSSFFSSVAEIVAQQSKDMALRRGPGLMVVTNRGSGGSGSWKIASNVFQANAAVTDLLSCNTATTGGDRSLTVTWTSGEPFYFVTSELAASSGICGEASGNAGSSKSSSTSTSSVSSGASGSASQPPKTASGGTSPGAGKPGEGSPPSSSAQAASGGSPTTVAPTTSGGGAGGSEGDEGATRTPTSSSGGGHEPTPEHQHGPGEAGGKHEEQHLTSTDPTPAGDTSARPPATSADPGDSTTASPPPVLNNSGSSSAQSSGSIAGAPGSPSKSAGGANTPTGGACKRRSRRSVGAAAFALVVGGMILA